MVKTTKKEKQQAARDGYEKLQKVFGNVVTCFDMRTGKTTIETLAEAFLPLESCFKKYSCSHCSKSGVSGDFKKCGGCGTRYCSRECQKNDWKTHKPSCKSMSKGDKKVCENMVKRFKKLETDPVFMSKLHNSMSAQKGDGEIPVIEFVADGRIGLGWGIPPDTKISRQKLANGLISYTGVQLVTKIDSGYVRQDMLF
jgi:hypothetical protein